MSTTKTPNNSSTGGSGTSECSAQAARVACEILNTRLAPYKAKGENWEEALTAAANDGIPLTGYGTYQAVSLTDTNPYATYGVSCTEVDGLTLALNPDPNHNPDLRLRSTC